MDTQSYDADRLFPTNTGPYCSGYCPRCGCPDGKVENDTWYHESQPSLWFIYDNYTECSLCTCKKDEIYGTGNLYADCEWKGYYKLGAQSCPKESSEVYSCHEQESTTSPEVSDSVNSAECSRYCGIDGDILLSKNYCQWSYDDTVFRYGLDDGAYKWGCGSSIFCEAFADNTCVYANTTYTYTDCYGVEKTQKVYGYLSCCDLSSGDNCNYVTASLDECTRSTAYETFWAGLSKCNTDPPRSICADAVDEITCDGIAELYETPYACYCSAYAQLYANVGTESKAILQSDTDQYWPQGVGNDFAQWNEQLGCDISFQCDLRTGSVNSSPLPTTAEPTTDKATTPEPTTPWPTTPAPTTFEPTASDQTISEGTTVEPTTPAPVEVIENECEEECKDTETCNSDGECVTDVIGQCTDDNECNDGYVCETMNNGNFCFYDECLYAGDCDEGFRCVETTKTQADIQYQTGICAEEVQSTNSVTSFQVIVAIIISSMIIIVFP